MQQFPKDHKYQLRSPNGSPITHIVSTTASRIRLNQPYNLLGGTVLSLYTSMQTDTIKFSEEARTFGGEVIYVDELGAQHLAGDLHVVQINNDDTETYIDYEFTGGYAEPSDTPAEQAGGPRYAKQRALELATWVADAQLSYEHPFLTPEARERITKRAHAYAKKEGVLEAFNGILEALNLEGEA